MKRLIIILVTAVLLFGLGWWANEMIGFANGVIADNSKDLKADSQKFIIISSTGSFDSISKLLQDKTTVGRYGQLLLNYKDKDYSVSSADFGEWGGYILFKDSVTKTRYAFPQNSIFSFGKNDSSYVVFCYISHTGSGTFTEIKKPKNLFKLDNTCKYCPQHHKLDSFRKAVLLHPRILNQISDHGDTNYNFVGAFNFENQFYAIQSTNIVWNKKEKLTVISKVDLNKKTFTVIDTILNFVVYPPTNSAGISDIYSKTQYIPFKRGKTKGYFIIVSDTINILTEKETAE